MGFFLPALFVGGLGVTQHLASRELDDIVRQAEQPVFGFWWGFSLGALTGLWIGCNFGPLLLKIRDFMSAVGGWMFLSPPSPLRPAATVTDNAPPSAAAAGPAAGYPFVQASSYVPFAHAEHLPQQQHHHYRSSPHDTAHSDSSGSHTHTGTRTERGGGGGGGGSGDGHVLAPYCPSDSTHGPRQNDDLAKHAFWTQQQQHPHAGHTAGRSITFTSPLPTPLTTEHLHHVEQNTKRSATTGTWW